LSATKAQRHEENRIFLVLQQKAYDFLSELSVSAALR